MPCRCTRTVRPSSRLRAQASPGRWGASPAIRVAGLSGRARSCKITGRSPALKRAKELEVNLDLAEQCVGARVGVRPIAGVAQTSTTDNGDLSRPTLTLARPTAEIRSGRIATVSRSCACEQLMPPVMARRCGHPTTTRRHTGRAVVGTRPASLLPWTIFSSEPVALLGRSCLAMRSGSRRSAAAVLHRSARRGPANKAPLPGWTKRGRVARSPARRRQACCLTCPAVGCQPPSVVKGVRARVEGNGFARGRPALLWSTARGWLPGRRQDVRWGDPAGGSVAAAQSF